MNSDPYGMWCIHYAKLDDIRNWNVMKLCRKDNVLVAAKTYDEVFKFIVLETKPAKESTNEQINQAFNWYKTVTSGGVKAHDADIKAKVNKQTEEVPF